MFKILIHFILLYKIDSKYIEGRLNTKENWAFLTRFCFLSEEGQYEYHIEFNENQGDPNLLLYYDTNDQWPAVYKTKKTCSEREKVLVGGGNQIIPLTARFMETREFSGCTFVPKTPTTTPTPHYSLNVPTLATKKLNTTTKKSTPNNTPPPSTTFTTFPSSSTSFLTESTEFSSSYTSDEATTESIFTTELITTIETQTTSKGTKKLVIRKRSVPLRVPSYLQRYGRTVSCHSARRFRSARERWWFIAVSNCNSSQGIDIEYKFLMTNGLPGDYWHEHFSADEFYILPVLMAFSIAYSFVLLGIVMCTIELKSRQLLHTTYKIFVLSVVFQLFGIMVESVVYLKYAVTGLEAPKVRRFAKMLMGASEICFLLQLLLLAKGYTITRGRLPLSASVKLTIFMCIYVVTYVSIFIYEAKVFDPGEVLYLYESPAGYALITLRIVAWCMFVYSTIFTLKHYPEKNNFYYPFNIFGTLWFVAGPAFVLSANTYIDKWVRESVVCAVLLFIAFGGHLMFLILTMPSVANKNFPYHVRTTQIGIMELTDGNAGGGHIEQFTHHVYEPTARIREQTVIVPLTRRTEEIFEGMYNQRAFQRNVSSETTQETPGNKDLAIENVLSWSLVKNMPATELPPFQKIRRDSIDSEEHSQESENSTNNEEINRTPLTSTSPKLQQQLSANSSRRTNAENSSIELNDYVKEVPVELFTISKMVVETNRLKLNNGNQH